LFDFLLLLILAQIIKFGTFYRFLTKLIDVFLINLDASVLILENLMLFNLPLQAKDLQ